MTMNISCSASGRQNGRLLDESAPAVQARYQLNDIFCGMWLCNTIVALARLKVFDLIDESGVSAESIAARLELDGPMLYRALRAVAANGILVETSFRTFKPGAVSTLLRSDHPESWRGMALMWGHTVSTRSWEQFAEVLRDGRSGVTHAYGKTLYEQLHVEPEATQAFSAAMISNSAQTAKAIAAAFPFEKFSTVLDLAGGVGTMLEGILQVHPHLFGGILEISDLQEAAEHAMSAAGLSKRTVFIPGDFRQRVPANFDVYLVKNSMWNWNDADCLSIMHSVRSAIGGADDKRFVIIEYIIDAENKSWTTLYDMQIANLPGGRARTQSEYEELLRNGGFELERVTRAQDQTLLIAKPV